MCVAAAIAGGAVLSAGVGAYSANKAAGAQKAAANSANATQMSMFNQIQANETPYMNAGAGAIGQLQSIYGLGGKGPNAQSIMNTLQQLPGYQFQMGQGVQALDRSAASKGLLNSGAQGKALTAYGQGLGSSYLQNYVGGLGDIARMGQASAGQQAAVGMNTANQMGANYLSYGNAAAAGTMGVNSAIQGGLQGLYGAYGGGFGAKYPSGQPNSYAALSQPYNPNSTTFDASTGGTTGGWG
jgi:hypothetical protein